MSIPKKIYVHIMETIGANLPRIRCIAWNPLGTLVATGSSDKALRVCKLYPKLRFPWNRHSL